MQIYHNIAALNATRQLGINTVLANKSLARLSSGLRINSAADDAAGLAISEKMRLQIRGLDQAIKNSQDGTSMVQTADSALQEIHGMLDRMYELANQAANGLLTDADRNVAQEEVSSLLSQINTIAKSTKFNNKILLDGNFGVTRSGGTLAATDGALSVEVAGAKASTTYTLGNTADGVVSLSDGSGNQQTLSGVTGNSTLNFDKLGVKIVLSGATVTSVGSTLNGKTIITSANAPVTLQIGAENSVDQQIGVSIADMDTTALGISTINIATQSGAQSAMTNLDTAKTTVNTERAKLGALQNRLEYTIKNLGATKENMATAEARIRDADMAKEMMEFTKFNILNQAATAMLAQANQMPQTVLQLLR
ncbi:flagellin N-terminal helical domain-containing protein [Desulforudis sp. DRI-14]|uniref:flagellin N-terminal helical domain-containing protein n=1 Tax=Desulforudis sp. DRI-14 TaxID=3459793 RepID=UPI004042BA09